MDLSLIDPLARPSKDEQKRARKREAQRKYSKFQCTPSLGQPATRRNASRSRSSPGADFLTSTYELVGRRLRQRSEGGEERSEGEGSVDRSVPATAKSQTAPGAHWSWKAHCEDSEATVMPERDGSSNGNEAQELGHTPICDLPLSSYVGESEAPEHLLADAEISFPSGGDTGLAVSIPHFGHCQPPLLASDALWPALAGGSGSGASEDDELLRIFGNLTNNIAEGVSEQHPPPQGDYRPFTTIDTPQSDMVTSHAEKSQWNAPHSQAAQASLQNLSRPLSGPFIDESPFSRHINKGTKKPLTSDAKLRVACITDANADSRQSANGIISNVSSSVVWKGGQATTITNTGPAVRKPGATGSVEKEQRGYTPLFQAVAQGQVKIVKILMRRCNNVNATDETGETMLHLAAKRGNARIVDFLLECGVDLDVCDHGGNTALHLAVANGHEDVVEMLVEAGADTDIVSRPRR